jgi:hypothetical protein
MSDDSLGNWLNLCCNSWRLNVSFDLSLNVVGGCDLSKRFVLCAVVLDDVFEGCLSRCGHYINQNIL